MTLDVDVDVDMDNEDFFRIDAYCNHYSTI